MAPDHVLIVGGGLAGPALALSLARQNIRSTIFEIRSERGDSGGSITLAPNALRVLDKSVGVYAALHAAGVVSRRVGMYAEDGFKFGEIYQDGDYPSMRILRSAVHRILLEACAKAKGLINFVWGAKLSKVEEDGEGVTAFFEGETSVTGDILVGADGIHSKVREHVLGDQAPTPVFTGSCTVNGFLPSDSVTFPKDFVLPAAILTPLGIVFVVAMDLAGKTIAWGVSQQVAERDRAGWREYEISGEALRAVTAKDAYGAFTAEPLPTLFRQIESAKTETRVWAPYSILQDLPTWHSEPGRVCLIGDAAHALPPAGQGSAQAFEDAALLARMLAADRGAAGRGYAALLARFETLRRRRIEQSKRFSRISGQAKARSSPWVWYFKKWMVWFFFACNGFTIRGGAFTSYDVMTEDIQVE